MKNVAILVVETAVIEAVADPRYMFTAVNEFLKSRGEQPLFHVQLVGLTKEVKLADGLFSIHTDAVLKDARRPDLIIIPALSGNLEQAIPAQRSIYTLDCAAIQTGSRSSQPVPGRISAGFNRTT